MKSIFLQVAKEQGIYNILPNEKQAINCIINHYISGDKHIKKRIDELAKG